MTNQLDIENRSHDAQAGFTLLETIVAVAILAMAMMPLLTLQSQLASHTVRLEIQADRIQAKAVAKEYLLFVNPLVSPVGSQTLGGGWKLSWTSQPLAPAVPARFGIGLSSRYVTQTFLINATLVRNNNTSLTISRHALGILEIAPFRSG